MTSGNDGKVGSYKAPPAYEEGQNYADWKLDIELWQEFTTLEKKKQGTALLLELKPGKVKDAVRGLGKEVLTAEDGIAKIIVHLNKIYEEDPAQICYRAYSKFEKFCRPESMSLQSYISEFEKMLADLKRHSITLPPTVVAYRFLNSANLSSDKVNLALATVKELTYKEMSVTVGKIFSVQANSFANDDVTSPSVKIEPEECYYTNGFGYSSQKWDGYPRRKMKGQGSYHPYKPRNSYSGCYGCGDKDHVVRMCPKKKSEPNSSDPSFHMQYLAQDGAQQISKMEAEDCAGSGSTYFAFLVSECQAAGKVTEDCFVNDQPNLGSLVHETLACAVIDSGCTKTVVGRNWINYYKETLDEDQLRLMMIEKCATPFRFGDGLEVVSTEKIKIPGRIGKSNILVEANIVERDLPLLLSKASLKKAGAVLDFTSDTLQFNGECINLFETESKHYCIPLCDKKRLVIGPEHWKRPKLVLTITKETRFGKDPNEIKRKVEELHRKFSHPPSEKLKTALKTAGFERREYMEAIDEVTKNCPICSKYRPKIGCGKVSNKCAVIDFEQVPEYYHNGAKVMYKKKGSTKWSGPGVILGRDSTSHYIIKQGNQYYKCKTCHLTLVTKSRYPIADVQQSHYDKERVNDKSVAHEKVCSISPQKQRNYLETEVLSPKEEIIPECDDQAERITLNSRVGQSGLTIQLDNDDNIKCVDWQEHVAEWREDIAPEREEVLSPSVCMYEQEVSDVKQAELEKMNAIEEMEEVMYADQSTIGARWVAKKKADGTVKVTLIAMGYQENRLEK